MAKLSGPRMRSGAYYSKRRAGRRPARKPKGLDKVEKKQVNKMINKKIETKYFDVSRAENLDEILPHPSAVSSNMYVKSFQTGGPANDFDYGQDASTELNLARCANPDATSPISEYTRDGQEVKPLYAQTKWFIEASHINLDVTGEQIRDCLPTLVRMIHVKVKQVAGLDEPPNPEDDLFLDQVNQPTGINIAGFTKTNLVNCRVNGRRYTVIADKQWVMAPPLTSNPLDVGAGTTQPRNINTVTSKKYFTTRHKVCNKNQKLFYKIGEERPFSNEQLEFVFFHFQHLGDKNSIRASADDFRITAYPTSSFKDA